MPWITLLALLACAAAATAAAALACSLLALRRAANTMPARALTRLSEFGQELRDGLAQVDDLRSEQRRFVTNIEGELEEMSKLADRVERKRKQIAAQQQGLGQVEEQQQLTEQEALQAWWREQKARRGVAS